MGDQVEERVRGLSVESHASTPHGQFYDVVCLAYEDRDALCAEVERLRSALSKAEEENRIIGYAMALCDLESLKGDMTKKELLAAGEFPCRSCVKRARAALGPPPETTP